MSTVILDDRDSSIVYHGDTWVPSGNPTAEYLGTSMGTAPAFGTSVTVAFTGTGITVFGTLNPGVQISMFSVDGSPPTTFTSTDASSIRYAQAFYTANPGTFSPGAHTLVMTPLQADFWLDFLKVDGPSATSSSASSETLPNSIRSTSKSSAQAVPTVNSPPPKATNVNTSTSTSTSAPIKVSTASSTTSASNIGPTIAETEPTSSLIPASNNSASIPSDDSVQKQRNTPLNPIVGGALGGVALLFVLFLIFLGWLLRRKKLRDSPREAKHPSEISPFNVAVSDSRLMSDFGYLPATKQSDTSQNDFACRGGDRRLGPDYHENTQRPSQPSRESSPPPMYCSTWNS